MVKSISAKAGGAKIKINPEKRMERGCLESLVAISGAVDSKGEAAGLITEKVEIFKLSENTAGPRMMPRPLDKRTDRLDRSLEEYKAGYERTERSTGRSADKEGRGRISKSRDGPEMPLLADGHEKNRSRSRERLPSSRSGSRNRRRSRERSRERSFSHGRRSDHGRRSRSHERRAYRHPNDEQRSRGRSRENSERRRPRSRERSPTDKYAIEEAAREQRRWEEEMREKRRIEGRLLVRN